jgi:hypothetical protein
MNDAMSAAALAVVTILMTTLPSLVPSDLRRVKASRVPSGIASGRVAIVPEIARRPMV